MKALLSPEEPAGDKAGCWNVRVTFPSAHGNLLISALSCFSVVEGAWGWCGGSAERGWVLLAVLGSGSAAPSPSVGFGISCLQGVRAGSDCRSIEQFSEASHTLVAISSPRSWSKEGGKALLRVCVGQTLPTSTGRRVPLQELPDKSPGT